MKKREREKFVVPFSNRLNRILLSSLIFALIFHFGVLITAFISRDYRVSEAMSFEGASRFVVELSVIEEEDILEEDLSIELESESVGEEKGVFSEGVEYGMSKVEGGGVELDVRVRDVGVLSVVSSLSSSGALSSVFGERSSFSEQLSAAVVGGEEGELVMGHGWGGMGLRGTGGGGGGFGRVNGMGRVDIGVGGGIRSRLSGRNSVSKKFSVEKGNPVVSNYCKGSDILRVVSNRQRSIQYCYEKELGRNPELKGKVIVSWRVGLSGRVMKSWIESTSLKSGAVESCIIRSVKRWTFNKPEGGICEIKFPFVFSQGF